MSKQKTKADLERDIQMLQNTIKVRDQQISDLEVENKSRTYRYDQLLEQLSLALKDQFEGYEFNRFGTVNREHLQALTVNGIFFKIGRLTHIAKEYEELKDRTLPLPKMRVYEIENRVENNRKDTHL